jgi:hypothetical protein
MLYTRVPWQLPLFTLWWLVAVRGMCQQPTLICILCIASATWSAAVYVEKWWPALVQMSISMSCMPLLISSPPPLLPLSVIFICSVCTHIMHPRITVQETLHPWVSCVLFRARSLVEIEFVLCNKWAYYQWFWAESTCSYCLLMNMCILSASKHWHFEILILVYKYRYMRDSCVSQCMMLSG